MPIPRLPFRLLLPLAALACGSSDLALPTDAPSAQLEMVQGNEQVGQPGAPLKDPLIVRVTDSAGNPLPGQPVDWAVNGGGGAVDPASSTSNAEGLAFAEWILGPEAGLNVVEAQVAGLDAVTFTATARSGGSGGTGGGGDSASVATHLSAVEGDGQTAKTGTPVAVRPAVRVTDSDGNPVAGITVTFAVTAGGGSLEGATQTSGDDGIARVGRWTLGSEPGSNTLEARSGSLEGSPVIFTAEATAPAPEPPAEVNRLVYQFPPPRQAKKDQPFAVKVALVDKNGNVVPLDGILIYLGLFPEGSETPRNQLLNGNRFQSTVDGMATFELSIVEKGSYRLRALTDDLPELGPHGPEPWLYSYVFEVK
jgi:Bacterial Ig-like domain (group 1)